MRKRLARLPGIAAIAADGVAATSDRGSRPGQANGRGITATTLSNGGYGY